MADANFTATSKVSDIKDLLLRTVSELSFIQSITLLPGTDELTLDTEQTTGLYYSLEHIKDNIALAAKAIATNGKESSHE